MGKLKPSKKVKSPNSNNKKQRQQEEKSSTEKQELDKTSDASNSPSSGGGGDDLEDNLLIEDDFLDEDAAATDVSSDVSSDAQFEEDEDDSDNEEKKKDSFEKQEQSRASKKRRTNDSEAVDPKPDKNNNKNNNNKTNNNKKNQYSIDKDMWNESAARQTPQIQADRVAESQLRALPGISKMELDEIRLSESFFSDLTNVSEPWMDVGTMIEQGLKDSCGQLSKNPKVNGSPRVIIIASSALRAIAIYKEVKRLAGNSKVGQLFAKHHSLSEHAEWVKKTGLNIVVGTPDRLRKLIEMDALSIASTAYLILDTTFRDSKSQNVLDQIDIRKTLFGSLLADKKIMDRLRSQRMKIALA